MSFSFANNDDLTWEFGGSTDSGTLTAQRLWVPWEKAWAPGCRFLGLWVCGAAAGGGGGHTKGAAGNAGGGGGGGGSGAMVRAIFLLSDLPDIIYLYLPYGGRGGATGIPGEVGGRAYVSINPSSGSVLNELILVSGGADATGGGAGTGAARGAGGVGSTIAAFQTAGFSWKALAWSALAGISGTQGGQHTNGAGVAVDVTTLLSGGAGGAGSQTTASAGGAVTGSGFLPTLPGGAAGPNAGSDGIGETNDGPSFPYPWHGTPGAGGGSTNTAGETGGRGGHAGGPGQGGAGGGAGVVAGGAGGNGGDAYAQVAAWG